MTNEKMENIKNIIERETGFAVYSLIEVEDDDEGSYAVVVEVGFYSALGEEFINRDRRGNPLALAGGRSAVRL